VSVAEVVHLLSGLLALWFASVAPVRADPRVTLEKTPHGGIQPQAAVDAEGTLHLIYFKGEAAAGDLFYVRRKRGEARFSDPIRINSLAGSAVATGTVRGGRMALGKSGRVHVVWNGSARTKGARGAPMLYTRSNDAGTAFEKQRDLMRQTTGLDGGGTVAADDAGNVYVAWHARKIGSRRGEKNRRVWIARSTDEGKTFAAETPAWSQPTGACGCCSMGGLADRNGSIYLLYRSAKSGNRDIYLLSASRAGAVFRGALVHKWKVSMCPMSTMALAEGPERVVSAWETEGRIYFARIKPGSTDFARPLSATPFGGTCKHPAAAVDGRGKVILAWTEGTGWRRGGDLAWQVFDKSDRPTAERGRLASGIPVWGLPAVVAWEGRFVIFH